MGALARRGTPWSSSWRAISGAESAAYAAVEADLGYYLRVTASYEDGHGPDKSKAGDLGRRRHGVHRAGVPGRPQWCVRAERGGEHGRRRGRGGAGGGNEPGRRRADLRAWGRGRGAVRHRRGHGTDQGRGRDGAGLRGGPRTSTR